MDFDTLFARLVLREGGYVNDPDDPGGETKYGITKRDFPSLDIKNLTKEKARDIYFKKYYIPSRAAELPDRLKEVYFDMCVHMGTKRAIKILQRAINHKTGRNIKEDGILGDQTLIGAVELETERLRAFRVLYYAELVVKRPTLMKYWYGWYNRAKSV